MFGKLLKNDLKAQAHTMSGIFLVIAIVSVAAECVAVFSSKDIVAALAGMLVMLALGFACVVVIIACAIMFNNTMFGRAGYLTLTLPVKTDSLIISKSLSSLIWIFTTYALFIGSLVLWIYQVQKRLGEQVADSIETLFTLIGAPSFSTIAACVGIFLVTLAVIVLLSVQSLQFAISASNVSPVSKFGTIGAIILFFVTFGVLQTVSSSVSEVLPIGAVITSETIKFTTDIAATKANETAGAIAVNMAGTLTRVILAVAMHFPTAYLVKHKINVK
ncbi:MAG: hypothetical protein ACI4IF_00225 [Acutalibacteraceae bacterium]